MRGCGRKPSYVEYEQRAFGPRAADHRVALAIVLVQDRIAVLRLTVQVAGDARSAVAIFAVGLDVEAVVAQHRDDRAVCGNVEHLAAAPDLDLESSIDRVAAILRGGEILTVHVERWPSSDAGLGGA